MHHLQDDNIRNKIKQTNLIRYGAENAGCNKDVDNKRKMTNLKRYGVENPMQNPDIVQKSIQNRMQLSRCIFPENMKSKAVELWRLGHTNIKQNDVITTKTRLNYMDCKMMIIYRRTASIFMNKYHTYGWDSRGKLCIGWVYKNKLIQLITFGKAKDSTYTYQIYQACNHPRYEIDEGLYRLYEHAVKYFEINNVVLYEDIRYARLYKELKLMRMIKTLSIKIWYHENLMIPDDQIFNRDLIKLFGPQARIQDKEFLFETNHWNLCSRDFLVFSHTRNHITDQEIHHNVSDLV